MSVDQTDDARERRVNPPRAKTPPRGGDEEQREQERGGEPEGLEERCGDVRPDAPRSSCAPPTLRPRLHDGSFGL